MYPLERHIIRKHNIGDRTIFVIDGIFDESFIRMVHHFMSRLEFTLSDYDTELTKHVRHWKHEFDTGELQAVPLPIIRELVSRALTLAEALYSPPLKLKLERVHCNLHHYGDMQHPHTDIVPGVTALYFANPIWDVDWMGETLFYNDVEPLHAVAPKPGRFLVFNGDIRHRAGVPSRVCFEPRISVAFKFLAKV